MTTRRGRQMQQLTPDSLFQTFTSILEASHQLSAQLAQAADSLREKGEIPGEGLLKDITTLRRQFLDLRAQGVAVAETLSLPSQPSVKTVTSLHSLKTLLEETEKAEEQKTRYQDILHQALSALDRVMLIQHQDQENFPPLLECQERAREMRETLATTTWSNIHPAIEALANGEDPFSDLLTWIEQQNTLEDDHWAVLQDTVEQFFGKQLAIAVSRGKLFLPALPTDETVVSHDHPITTLAEVRSEPTGDSGIDDSGTDDPVIDGSDAVPLTSPISTSAEVPSEPMGDSAIDDSAMDEGKGQHAPHHEETFVSIEVPQGTAEHSQHEDETFSVSEALEDAPPSGPERKEPVESAPEAADAKQLTDLTPLASPYRFGRDDPAQHIAATMLQEQSGPYPPTTLRDLTWRLIFEDKLTLAFHLASYLDAKHPQLPLRPAGWMLRSIVLGRHIRHAKGETARFLEGDFRHFSPALYLPDQNEWNQAVTFLLAAATLQPALLAPYTQAPAVLQSLRWDASLSQLSSYCKSIADYGANQSPLNPTHLKKGKEQASWQSDIDTLKQAVELWWTRAPRIAFTYAPATKVWQKWLEPKGVIATLLTPIRQNDTSKVSAVQQLIEAFSNNVRLTSEVQYTDQEILGRHLGGDISGRALEQIRLQTREAMGFARRWVELQEILSGQRPNTSFEKIEQLRQTIWTLQGTVQEELSLFKRRHPSLLMISSLLCCRRAIDQLQILFDPEAAFPTEEPLPRPLLYADLLRIPTVSLNDQWEVEGSDWEPLIEGVLTLLANSSARKAAA